MKKFLALALTAVLLLSACLVGCGKKKTGVDEIPDNMTSSDGKYEIAFVTDVGSLKDQSFNQGTGKASRSTLPTTASPTSTISPQTAIRRPMMTASTP